MSRCTPQGPFLPFTSADSLPDRGFYRTGQLTPVSNASVSPRTPLGMRSAFDSRLGDDYFAPNGAGDFASPSSQPQRPGGYGGLSPVDDTDAYRSASSPSNNSNVLRRMNTIVPGPFEVRPKTSDSRNAPPSRSGDSVSSNDSSSRSNNAGPNDRYNNSSDQLATSAPSAMPPPPLRRNDGYGGLETLHQDGDVPRAEGFDPPQFSRAGTFPRLNDSITLLRTPSVPGSRRHQPSHSAPFNNQNGDSNGALSPRPSTNAGDRTTRQLMGPDTSRAPPPRTSLIRPSTRNGGGNVPQINLAAEFGIGNPYHAPSESMSSTVSSLSPLGVPSSVSSFSSTSSFHTSSSSNASDHNRPKTANSDSSNSRAGFGSFTSDFDSMSVGEKPRQLSILGNNNSNNNNNNNNGDNKGRIRPRSPLASPTWDSSSNVNNTPSVQENKEAQRPVSRERGDDRKASMPEPSRPRDQPSAPVPSRGSCKACGDPITGKSVSSADGRLTGRYHKACFVCATCSEPFTSATFYVHDDKPYCEQHYHQVNGSLCGTCGGGIEGQYLADDTDQKYHPTCFSCADCRMPLRDGYFEVAGKFYCERDASRRVQQAWAPPPNMRPYQPNNRLQPGGKNFIPPRGPPGRPGMGLPSGPGPRFGPGGMGGGLPPRPYGYGPPNGGGRLGPRPRMEKRMTRLGMMN